MKPPRLFAEIPAGLGSVSLVLQGGRHCKPPVSRMGNKHGYALPILDAMGLRPGQGAESYLWCEADPDVRALLCAYTQPDLLRAVAGVLRGWKDEEPRALWERLRAERKARSVQATHDVAYEDAGWIVTNGWAAHGKDAEFYGGPDRPRANSDQPTAITLDGLTDRCHRLAEYASIVAEPAAAWAWLQSRSVGGIPVSEGLPFYGPTMPAGDPKDALRGRRVATCDGVAQGFERVAEWSFLHQGSFQYKGPDAGIGRPEGMDARDDHGAIRPVCDILGDAFPRLVSRWPPVAVLATLPTAVELSAMLGTPGDLEGVVVYMDPPYVGTTGYLADLPRAEVVRLATEYAAAGALVVVSEAVAIPELTALGWDAVNIGGERRGQRRTFGATEEWITMSRPPVNRPAIQGALFAMGGS